jgi:hypothetical protein
MGAPGTVHQRLEERGKQMINPRMGDIGEPIRHVELEPVEVPATVPEPVTVPDRELVPA